MADTYDDTGISEGRVRNTGSTPTASPPQGPSGRNSNPATTQQSGTENLGTTATTTQANRSEPGNGKSQWPAIQTYNDSGV